VALTRYQRADHVVEWEQCGAKYFALSLSLSGTCCNVTRDTVSTNSFNRVDKDTAVSLQYVDTFLTVKAAGACYLYDCGVPQEVSTNYVHTEGTSDVTATLCMCRRVICVISYDTPCCTRSRSTHVDNRKQYMSVHNSARVAYLICIMSVLLRRKSACPRVREPWIIGVESDFHFLDGLLLLQPSRRNNKTQPATNPPPMYDDLTANIYDIFIIYTI